MDKSEQALQWAFQYLNSDKKSSIKSHHKIVQTSYSVVYRQDSLLIADGLTRKEIRGINWKLLYKIQVKVIIFLKACLLYIQLLFALIT